MRQETGVTILTKWGFTADIVDVAANAQYWNYEGTDQIDYVDVVTMAHLVYQAHRSEEGRERLTSSPVFQKIPLTDDEIQDRIDEATVMKSLLIS
ncbi:MAG: hypothetical protein HOM11_03585 [Methylococcales bacterium]|nr:hypothetical protein [Methylococcales bacterium]